MLRTDGYRDKHFIWHRGWLLQRSEVHCQNNMDKLMLLLLPAMCLLRRKKKQLSFWHDGAMNSSTVFKARTNQWTRNYYPMAYCSICLLHSELSICLKVWKEDRDGSNTLEKHSSTRKRKSLLTTSSLLLIVKGNGEQLTSQRWWEKNYLKCASAKDWIKLN